MWQQRQKTSLATDDVNATFNYCRRERPVISDIHLDSAIAL